MTVSRVERNYGLDLLRALAIFMVVASHTVSFFKIDSVFAAFLRPILVFFGFTGVELFFVLSGFLIGRILMTEFESFHGSKTIKNFWARRWFRTLPAYYFYLILYVLFDLIRSRPMPDVGSYALFLQNLFWTMPGFFGQSWSLVVEEWFYLLFPLLTLIFLPFLRGRKAVLWAAILLGILSFAGRLYLAQKFPDWNWRYDLRKVALVRFDSLMLGVLLAYIKVAHTLVYRLIKDFGFWLGLGVLLCCYFISHWAEQYVISKSLILLLCPAGFALLLPRVESFVASPGCCKSWVTCISEWSYSIYLSNNMILAIVLILKKKLFSLNSIWVSFLSTLVFLIITMLVSVLTYRFVERPFLKLRDRYFPA